MKNIFGKFYLDKEKDIVVNLYRENEDELIYVLETPNHNTGNLITNLAKICNLETIKNENGIKIITGKIFESINGDYEGVYIFRLGGIKIANIYVDGTIEIKAKIPAISKTLMSQTKNYNLPIEKTIIKSYIYKKSKFRTDLHTHMNANLSPDILIALGIAHQIQYPLYYIKKLNLKITKEQEERIYEQRKEVEKRFEDSELVGKYLIRRIDDNTFINFADLILNNLDNAEYNISKIRTSLAILKDGQAVFTNMEKSYLYRYVFAKGKPSKNKITLQNIDKIPEKDIVECVKRILKDHEDSSYENNSLRQDKLLWIAREYKRQGIKYAEIADIDLVKVGEPAVFYLEEIHEVMPKIEKETGVKIRFLAGIRRIPLTIIRDQITKVDYLRENLDVLKATAKSPYVVGSDFIGEEINDITELKEEIEEIVKYVVNEDENFTIRIHAGENEGLRENVSKSIEAVINATPKGKKIPTVRIGHGLYTPDLDSEDGKKLIENLKKSNAILEFQLTSNVRLNNLNVLENHPLKKYLGFGVRCVQGTDGCGMYGTDTIDEQLALQNLLGLTDEEFMKMREVEEEVISSKEEYFINKSKKFSEFLGTKSLREAILELENKNIQASQKNKTVMKLSHYLEAEKQLKDKIKKIPENKIPIIIAGGSFNAKGRKTSASVEGINMLRELMKKLDEERVCFVIGYKAQGYEGAIIDIAKELNKKFEIYAIVPKFISEKVKNIMLSDDIDGVRVSTETFGLGIYKSFNYEIFERRESIVVVLDGNSAACNLIQEAKNGKAKSKIYVNEENSVLREKAKFLGGYVTLFRINTDVVKKILEDSGQ